MKKKPFSLSLEKYLQMYDFFKLIIKRLNAFKNENDIQIIIYCPVFLLVMQ